MPEGSYSKYQVKMLLILKVLKFSTDNYILLLIFTLFVNVVCVLRTVDFISELTSSIQQN